MPASRQMPDDAAPSLQPPPCPTCGDPGFVRREQIITGDTVVAFWTCASCLRSWPAPPVRMAKADLPRK